MQLLWVSTKDSHTVWRECRGASGAETETCRSARQDPGRLPPIRGRFASKIRFTISRMPKGTSSLSVLFPCAAEISPDHGKLFRQPGRRRPCQSITSHLGDLRFRPSPLQADERCDAGADQPGGAVTSWPASRIPGGRLAHCGLRPPPGMEDLYDKPFPTTLIGNSANQCYRNIKDPDRILHSRSSSISPWGETARIARRSKWKGAGIRTPRPSSCPAGC